MNTSIETATPEFAGRVAWVTGAGAGFGKAFAQALCKRGAAVALVDIDEGAAAGEAEALEAQGYRALAIGCDVADEGAVKRGMDRTAAELGGVDILINNAGLHSVRYNKGFDELGSAEVRRLFDVNVMGVVACSSAARPLMRARGGGNIINISSIAAYANETAYGVSKLAVRGLTIALAHEFSGDGIRVNAIAPGLMVTDTIRAELPAEMIEDFAANKQLVKRSGTPEDIVAAMLFLCSDAGSFMSGETLRVSGGFPLSI
jgi:NAD(P)-dependent dehydrogenase (short-subunit alcohol dehydrogenase family)